MAIPGLTIIGESINDSIPSTKKLYDANDLDGIIALAKAQDEGGAAWIDVNVGRRPAAFMADMIRRVQSVTAKPLSIDTPDPELAKAALEAYDPARAGGKMPVLNSVSSLRMGMLDLYKIRPFMPILLVSERMEGGAGKPNRTTGETVATAREMVAAIKASGLGIRNDQLIFDPGIGPIASDIEGMLGRILGSIKAIHSDPAFAGAHVSVGLSNFSHMLPSKKADGTPVKGAIENAFLTRAMPAGLDFIIGSVRRKYEILPDGHPALVCLDGAARIVGEDALDLVVEFYTG
ncbi:MAG: dihydropteroate synthase [Candidatus Coatesbacteria bacterium]